MLSESKEDKMNVKNYCTNVEMELTAWKAKLYNVVRQIEALPTGDKQRMYEYVNGLHILTSEIDDRIDSLRTSCPTEWNPERRELEGKFEDLGFKYEEAEKALFDYDIGG